jgi:hypothetical protein
MRKLSVFVSILAMSGLNSVIAEEGSCAVRTSLMALKYDLKYQPSAMASDSLPDADKALVRPGLSKPSSSWTKKGKILTFTGLGVAALGAFMMTKEDQPMGSTFNSRGQLVEMRLRMKVAGGMVLGTGAVISIFGLTRRE